MRWSLAVFGSLAVVMIGLSALTLAGETAPYAGDVRPTVERGLAFLVKDALAWKSQYSCVSCHHASLVIWSLHEAKEGGYGVDDKFLAELTKWTADSGDGKTSVKRPATATRALNTKALYFALALAADPSPDAVSRKGMRAFLKTVEADQTENGAWMAWPETRPPLFGKSDETMTALAVLAMLPAVTAGDSAAKAACDRGITWLARTKTDDDPQSVAMRLVLWRMLGRPDAECHSLVARIRNRQRPDGGWSQANHMPSDAWATGQALYALAHAGLGPADPQIARAREFLVKTQRPDGSWPMTSRPTKPGDTGAKSLVPITSAGTAWAVIGLARSGVR